MQTIECIIMTNLNTRVKLNLEDKMLNYTITIHIFT